MVNEGLNKLVNRRIKMKIKVNIGNGVCATITYLKGDGNLEFQTGNTGILHTPSGSNLYFEVVES